MVGTVVSLSTGPYADYIGRLYEHPAVHVHVAEGRSFLRATDKTYDIIQIFSNYTSSSMVSGSGALAPAYLLTQEAFLEYFTHLGPNGILHINHHTYPRMIATASAAWRSLGRPDFRAHVAIFEKRNEPDRLPTMLIKMSPWTPAEIADLIQFYSFPADGEPPYAIVENPLDPARSFLPDAFYAGQLPEALLEQAPYNVGVITDDRPAFSFLRRSVTELSPDRSSGLNLSTALHINSQLRRGWLPMDWLHLIVAGCASVFYGVLFILVPMLVSRVGRERWTGKAPALMYFAMLGFAFFAVELLFIQVFMKLIAGKESPRWYLAFAGVLFSGVAIWMAYAPVSEYFMASPTAVRTAAAAAMIFPVAFFMGMPFPLGILELRSKPAGAVAWAWSMNGLFTTIGSVASVLLSVWIGFRMTMLLALAVYAVAALMFGVLRRGNASEGAAAPGVPLAESETACPAA